MFRDTEIIRKMAERGKRAVFLCHNRHDKPFVRRVQRKLNKVGIQTWFDEAEILPGDSLLEKIESGLRGADYLAAFLSPDSIRSQWVKKELKVAIAVQKPEVILILLGDLSNRNIPPFLVDKQFVDFRAEYVFEKGLHELLMLLDDIYAELVDKTVQEITAAPTAYRPFIEALSITGWIEETQIDELAWGLHYANLYKDFGVDIKDLMVFVDKTNPERSLEKIAHMFKKDIPYPLWPYLASADTLRKLFRLFEKRA